MAQIFFWNVKIDKNLSYVVFVNGLHLQNLIQLMISQKFWVPTLVGSLFIPG